MALFLLSNVFLIISHKSLMEKLLSILLFGDESDMQVEWTPNAIVTTTEEPHALPTSSSLASSLSEKSMNDRYLNLFDNYTILFAILSDPSSIV